MVQTKHPPVILLFRPQLLTDERQFWDDGPASSGFPGSYTPMIPLLTKRIKHVRDQAMLPLSFSTPCPGLIHFELLFLRELFDTASRILRYGFENSSIALREFFDAASTFLAFSFETYSTHLRRPSNMGGRWVEDGWYKVLASSLHRNSLSSS